MRSELIQEFHTDHQKVVTALLELRQAVAERDVPRVRTIVQGAEGLLGPHFKFEELHLYPALEGFLGSPGVARLVREHDGVFDGVEAIADLARKDSWSEKDREAAEQILDLLSEHPVACDGLSLWLERLPFETHRELSRKLADIRRQGTTFSEYARERRPA